MKRSLRNKIRKESIYKNVNVPSDPQELINPTIAADINDLVVDSFLIQLAKGRSKDHELYKKFILYNEGEDYLHEFLRNDFIKKTGYRDVDEDKELKKMLKQNPELSLV